ncbi:MAG: hypothetical protein RR595_15905, partial [Lysinibacillus sp.]
SISFAIILFSASEVPKKPDIARDIMNNTVTTASIFLNKIITSPLSNQKSAHDIIFPNIIAAPTIFILCIKK